VLLVPSIWRNQEIIPLGEFANVAGRAGRAFVDVEGLVLHVVWEPNQDRGNRAVRQWKNLVAGAKASALASGLLQLAALIFDRIARAVGVSLEEVVEYVTGHGDAWDFSDLAKDNTGVSAAEWERDIASVDAAILVLLDADTEETNLDVELDAALEGSFFSRQLAREEEGVRTLCEVSSGHVPIGYGRRRARSSERGTTWPVSGSELGSS
jgi:hypothetical protein